MSITLQTILNMKGSVNVIRGIKQRLKEREERSFDRLVSSTIIYAEA